MLLFYIHWSNNIPMRRHDHHSKKVFLKLVFIRTFGNLKLTVLNLEFIRKNLIATFLLVSSSLIFSIAIKEHNLVNSNLFDTSFVKVVSVSVKPLKRAVCKKFNSGWKIIEMIILLKGPMAAPGHGYLEFNLRLIIGQSAIHVPMAHHLAAKIAIFLKQRFAIILSVIKIESFAFDPVMTWKFIRVLRKNHTF